MRARLRWENMGARNVLRRSLGPELFVSLMRVVDLHRRAEFKDREARRQLAQLRAWLGPEHWDSLNLILDNGTLSISSGRHEVIRRSRDAVLMVYEWEMERVRWGLDD